MQTLFGIPRYHPLVVFLLGSFGRLPSRGCSCTPSIGSVRRMIALMFSLERSGIRATLGVKITHAHESAAHRFKIVFI